MTNTCSVIGSPELFLVGGKGSSDRSSGRSHRYTNTESGPTRRPIAAGEYEGQSAFGSLQVFEDWAQPEDLVVDPRSSGAGLVRRPSLAVRRRRTLLAAFVLAMLILLALPWGGAGGRTLAKPGAGQAGSLVAGATYVVQPGDTLWGIADRLAGTSDPRPLVAQLEAEAGGDNIHPGQQLHLP